MSENAENPSFREPAEEILAQIQEQANTRVESPPQPGEAQSPPIPRAPAPGHTHAPPQNNSLNAARFSDRLFHAMLVRVALKYSGRVNLRWRQIIEGTLLFVAFILLASLVFIHYNFQRSPGTCLHDMKAEDVRKGIVRIEVVKNLKILIMKEKYVRNYVRAYNGRRCVFNPADALRFGPKTIPYSAQERQAYLAELERKRNKGADEPIRYSMYSTILSLMVKPMFWDEEEETDVFTNNKHFDSTDDLEFHDPIEVEAHNSFFEKIKDPEHGYAEPHEYEYLFRVEYAMLYGVLRLPPDFRDDHGIPTSRIRIDSKSKCFGDQMSRLMMKLFVGYEDTIIAALRAQAHNLSLVHPETLSMGYLHNLQTHEHFHFVSNMMGRASFLTAGLLMIIFTFAISMLLRFSHHQIFVFIIDLLHMFELQQPLNPPVAPLITVVLALVGMEAIMAEVFNDTSIAFYVILIVWVADQYDAICCHSTTSKKFWLRFFYIYQFFFYSYQYRFSGQYGGLALSTSALFILHSMVYFFHHYEMPLILYQDRVSQVLADLHAPTNGMGTVEVQTITVAVHNRSPQQPPSTPNSTGNGQQGSDNERPTVAEPLSPSSVFDARGPNLIVEAPPPEPVSEPEQRVPQQPEEIIAHQIVNDAMNELFNQE